MRKRRRLFQMAALVVATIGVSFLVTLSTIKAVSLDPHYYGCPAYGWLATCTPDEARQGYYFCCHCSTNCTDVSGWSAGFDCWTVDCPSICDATCCHSSQQTTQ